MLIAENHQATRDVFAAALSRDGYDTIVVATGIEVVPAMQAYRPDLVVLDHLLPGRNGVGMARELRLSPDTSQLPLVIAIADRIPGAATPSSDPLTRYVAKPVELIELTTAVRELIEPAPVPSDQGVVVPFRRPRSKRRGGRSNSTFEETLEAARHGDDHGFAQLYLSLGPRIQHYARARGAPQPEDLVNDVLLKIFTRLDQFEGNHAQFNAWVFQTVRNTLIDQARKRAVRPVETLVDVTPHAQSPDDPETAAIGNVELQSLLAHVDTLTADQRDVVLLRIVADLSIDSIAQILDKTPNATKALQRRAFTALSETLA